MRLPRLHASLLAATLLAGVRCAGAAGGHHAVDSATILDAGGCQVETWADAYRRGAGSWHVGPACRVGAWEIGLNFDGTGVPGEPLSHSFAPQAKWVTQLAPGWAAGVVLVANMADRRWAGFQPVGLLTWQAAAPLQLHLNAGRDLPPGGGGRTIAGAAAEWSASRRWSFVAERFNDTAGRAARLGMRWQPNPQFSLDVSRARALGDARGQWWSVGANYFFDR